MKGKIIKTIIIIFTFIFAARLTTIFAADRLYIMSFPAQKKKIPINRGIDYLNAATRLDSTNANLYFQKYELLDVQSKNQPQTTNYQLRKDQLYLLKHCIQLCPTWPAYHLYYALTLGQMSPRPNTITRQRILSELKKASELKPYSKLYRKIYKTYLKKFTY